MHLLQDRSSNADLGCLPQLLQVQLCPEAPLQHRTPCEGQVEFGFQDFADVHYENEIFPKPSHTAPILPIPFPRLTPGLPILARAARATPRLAGQDLPMQVAGYCPLEHRSRYGYELADSKFMVHSAGHLTGLEDHPGHALRIWHSWFSTPQRLCLDFCKTHRTAICSVQVTTCFVSRLDHCQR